MQLDLSRNDKWPTDRSERLWFFYANFEDAERCVLENKGDIFEYYYNVALIEEHYVHDPNDRPPSNFNGLIARQWWYKVDYIQKEDGSLSDMVISKIDAPRIFKNIINFWAG